MRGRIRAWGMTALLLCATAAQAGQLEDELDAILAATPPDKTVSALVYLSDQVDLELLEAEFTRLAAPLAVRHEVVVRSLQELASATQGPLAAYLEERKAAGGILSYRPYWIVNAFRVEGLPAEIRALGEREDVRTVFPDYGIELIEPVPMPGDGIVDDGNVLTAPEPGLIAIRAPEVWADGITGDGVLVATLDTGTDGNHVALASRWRGLDPRYQGHGDWAFFDPLTGRTFPFDSGSHGTHTMGTVCGGPPGNEIGVAPGAEWITAAVIDRQSIQRTVADAILAFQWMIDPDGDPQTNWDVPAVCSNSWGLLVAHGYPRCDQTFWQYLDACEAAGIVILFSAGNEGTSEMRRPADRATDDYRTCAVGAVDAQNPQGPWNIASFSSRGPTFCTPDGTAAIKPEIAAPGVNVRSSVPGNGYAQFSGTSMASPHVNGVVALMREVNPDLPVEDIKQIIYDTANDQGTPGNDNSYGWGMIDAYEAVALAQQGYRVIRFDFPNGRPTFLDPRGGTTIRVTVRGVNAIPARGSGKLYYDAGAGFVELSMNEVQQDVYDAVFPRLPCDINVNYYFSADDTDGNRYYNPRRAPADFYTANTTPLTEVWADNFETDRGWTVINENLTAGAWERGVPAGGGARGDPARDYDGSGACYLTGNTSGDSDVDGGPTRLISPLIDLSDGGEYLLSYARWMSNDDNDDQLVTQVSNNDGATWVTVESVVNSNGWQLRMFRISDFVPLTAQMRFRFNVADNPNTSVTEAAIDAVRVVFVDCPPPFDRGDMNCDGVVNSSDINGFILALFDPAEYARQYPNCDVNLADMNGDGRVDSADIQGFIDALFGP